MQQLAMKVLCSTLLLLAMVPCVCSQSDCSQAESCDLCVGDSMLNLTGCVWRLCPTGNDTGMCMTDGGDSSDIGMNCSWTRVSELCTVVETVAAGESGGDSGDATDTNSSTEFSQAKFNLSSFVGGIILVLLLQAGGLLAMRFLKSKEQSSYDPMDSPAASGGRNCYQHSLCTSSRSESKMSEGQSEKDGGQKQQQSSDSSRNGSKIFFLSLLSLAFSVDVPMCTPV